MPKPFVASMILLIAVSTFAPVIAPAQYRQPGEVYDFDRPNEKPAAAPKHDISGVWEPAKGPGAGIQGTGALSMGACEYKVPGDHYSGYAYDTKAPVHDTLTPTQEPPYTTAAR